MQKYAVNWRTPSGKYDGDEMYVDDLTDLINTIIALVQQKRIGEVLEVTDLDD